jgi:hypothetical protein
MLLILPRLTVLVPSGPVGDPNRKHLFVVLNAPYCESGGVPSVAMVSFRSLAPDLPYDQTCLLNKGDHPFIKHPTWVDYGKARIEAAAAIERGVRSGILVQHDPLSEAVFRRITAGLCTSPMTPMKVSDFYLAATH